LHTRLALLVAVALLATTCGQNVAEDEPGDPEPRVSVPAEPEPEPAEPPEPEPEPEPAPEPEPEPEPAPEPDPYDATVRGAWVHLFDDALKTRAGIAEVVDELAAADANTIVAQVARRYDAYYRSELLPRTPDPNLEPDLDVLEELIRLAHDRGMEVHAWLTVAPTWHHVYDDLPAPDRWLPPAHGRTAPEAQRWVTRNIDGEWSEYLDPALPQVGDYLVGAVAEIATKYPVDGIHLDYVRYASERHGYHPAALARYADETGRTGTPAPDDVAWSNWRRERTTELMTRVASTMNDIDPDLTLSAAVIAWGEGPGGPSTPGFEATRTYREALQDWPLWAREGLVDVIMPMVYFREGDDQQRAWFAQWTDYQRRLASEVDAKIVPGVGGWLNAPGHTFAQTVASMGVGDGAMVYSYQQPTADESRGVWSELADARWGFDG
jgi:uncharacterized lipoprotein YddW (UPF0748 family)